MSDHREKNRAAGNEQTLEQQKTVERAKSVKERYVDKLKTYPNVVGVGVGYEIVAGRRTDRVSIRVYVRKKLPKADLPPEAVLPDTIEGWPVDVIEDEFRLHQAPPITIEDHKRRHNFLVGGISIGNLIVGGSGTLGVSVFDNRTGQEMLLSNWHVLCSRDACQSGEPIIQPGTGGGDVGTAGDVVAQLIRSQLTDQVDAAIAQPLGQRPLFKEVLELGMVEGSNRAVLGMIVRKSGRTTGLTPGTVSDVSADLDVGPYPDGSTHSFSDQIVIESDTVDISLPGDSGSVWVDQTNRVVGLNFAGSGKRAVANHIDEVLTALDINLGPGMTVLDWHTRAGIL